MALGHPTFYLHIGLPKTGTTFLQQHILPRLTSICVRYKPSSRLVEKAYPWESGFRSFFDRSPAIWGSLGDRLFAEVLAGCESNEGLDLLVSDENLAPAMWYPRSFGAPQRGDFGLDPFSAVAHLRELAGVAARSGFPRTRVLITVRRQDTWLASAYAQDSDRWPNASQEHFESWVASILDPRRDFWSNGLALDYALLLRLVGEAVGPGNVLVLPYELMNEDLTEFLARWVSFLGTSDRPNELAGDLPGDQALQANVRSAGDATWALRPPRSLSRGRPWRATRILGRLGSPVRRRLGWRRHRGKEIRLTQSVQEQVLSTYRDSNRQLAGTVEPDLGRYGYV